VFATGELFLMNVTLNKNIKLITNYFLGPVVFLLLAYTIYRQVQQQHNWRQSLQFVKQAISGQQQWKIWLVFLLMFLNWGLEAKKWQLVIKSVQQIPFGTCFKAILTGVTIASFTPNRTGEYVGRMLYVDEGKRARSISLTILCSFAQMIITLITGSIGLIYLKTHRNYQITLNQHFFDLWLNIFLLFTVLILLIFLLFYFRVSWLVKFFAKKWAASKFFSYVKVLEDFNATFLLRILSLSLLRYIVFIVQYYLMFSVFGVSLSVTETLVGMSVVFLIIAIVPSFTFLSELGVRWEASIQIMELFGAGTVGILAASFGIWLVNLIIPALIGSLLILGIKLFRIKT
jgi:lysylphosphatidylglycerol synthase-like protein